MAQFLNEIPAKKPQSAEAKTVSDAIYVTRSRQEDERGKTAGIVHTGLISDETYCW